MAIAVVLVVLSSGLITSASGTSISSACPYANDWSCSPTAPGLSAHPSAAATPTVSWSQIHAAVSPVPRSAAAMAYDPVDGYVVMFGGDNGGHCLNDTWTYHAGTWKQLDITGPPIAPYECAYVEDMSWDAADGYVLFWGGGDSEVGSGTWAFVHGHWRQIETLGSPPANATEGSMAYDPAIGRVVLLVASACPLDYSCGPVSNWTNGTWEYSAGTWTHDLAGRQPEGLSGVVYAGGILGYGPGYILSYDSRLGKLLALGDGGPDLRDFNGNSSRWTTTDTAGQWVFNGTGWTQLGPLPMSYGGGGGFVYDPAVGEEVLCEDLLVAVGNWTPGTQHSYTWKSTSEPTWEYGPSGWSNTTLQAPPTRILQSMAFDASDGYLLLFGGSVINKSMTYGGGFENDTWMFSSAPYRIALNVSVSPSSVCAANESDCAGPGGATATLGLLAVPANQSVPDSQGGSVAIVGYGTYAWIPSLNLSLQLWRNLSFGPPSEATTACGHAIGSLANCPRVPRISGAGTPNGPVLTWNWTPGRGQGFGVAVGDWWTVTIPVQVTHAPPYGRVPLDGCRTSNCSAAEGAPVDRPAASTLSLPGYENDSVQNLSLPLVRILVLPPTVASSSPPGSTPPPAPGAPPAPVVAPVPTPVAVAPTPVSVPIAAGAAPVASSAGILPVLAGFMAAGFARVVTRQRAQAMRVAVANRSGAPRRPRDRTKGGA